MAEQALVADLRIGLSKFDADLRKAIASADKASAEISKAMNRVDASVKTIPVEVNKLNNSLKETEEATNRAAQASERQTAIMGRLKGSLAALGLAVTVQQLVQFALSTVKASEALTSIEKQLTMLTGSQKAAKAEMAFIRAETDRLALSTLEGAKGYARLANAAAGTKLQGEGARQVFIALNTVTRALSLSNEEYGRVLNQVTQIISKGRIQTEELITLAESGIPIFTLLAKSMNVSGKELSDMLQKGKVSSQALILVVDEVQKKYADLAEQASQTVPAQIQRGWNRLLLEVVDVTQGILNSGELLNAFKFKSNILDIFPDREVITARVDYIIRQFTAISLIVEGAFEHAANSIEKTFKAVVSKLETFLAPIGEFFKKLPGASWVAAQFQALIGGLSEAGKKIADAQKNTDKFKGLFFEIFGTEGQTAIQRWDNFVSDALANLGKEMPPLIDSKKMVSDVDAANQELIKLQEQATKDLARLQDEAREDKKNKDIAADEEHASRTVAMFRERVRAQEEADQRILESTKEAARAVQEVRLELEEELRGEQEETHEAFLRIVERTNTERMALEKQASDEFEKTIEKMKDNIQEAMADTISDAIKGDLDNLKDIASLIEDLFADTAANIAAAFIREFAIDPIVEKFKGIIARLQGIASEQAGGSGGQGGVGGSIIGGLGGIGAGVGVGMGVSKLAGGGKIGGAIGGAVGGAVGGAALTGAIWGSSVGPIGTIVGAAVGAIVGGVMGYLSSSKDAEKTSLRMQTTAGEPAVAENLARSQSPFGVISLFDKSMASKEVSNAATIAISEIDSGIAKLLDNRQRQIVQEYFQSAVPEGLQVESKNVGDAIAKAVQQRFYHAITALEGEETAKAVVGELYTATSQNIQGITARAMEALEILATIADFKAGDLSQTAQQIKAINEQFQQLKDRATVLGLPTEDIAAEQQRQLAKITTDFNQDIGDAILSITDPVKLEFDQLERMQEERRKNAVDAGADLVQLAKLEQLEREELEKKHQGNLTGITQEGQKAREEATTNIFRAIFGITDPLKASIMDIQAQVAAFQAQADAGLIPQSLVDRYEDVAMDDLEEKNRQRRQAEAQAVEDFNQGIYDSLLGMKDSYALELQQMDRMHAERYQKAIEMGADLNAVAQLNHAERLAAEQQHQDELTRIQAEAQQFREDTINGLFMDIYSITDPFRAAMLGIDIELKKLQKLVEEGIVPQSVVDRWEDTQRDVVIKQEQQRRDQEAQTITDFNNQISDSILALTNSAELERVQMERIQQERIDRAIELGADLSAVEQLNQLEREDYERKHQEEMNAIVLGAHRSILSAISSLVGTATAEIFSFLDQLDRYAEMAQQGLISWEEYSAYQGVGMQSILDKQQATEDEQLAAYDRQQQQILDNIARYGEQRDREIGQAAAQRKRESEQRARASQQAAEQRRRASQQAAEERKRASQQAAEQKKREAEQRKREAEQRKQEREQEAERRRQDVMKFNSALWGFTDPFKASMQQINEEVREFREMTKEGIISKKAVDQFQRLAVASLHVDRAVDAMSGGGGSPIEQVGESFEDFIRAGSPLSQTAQQMMTLQEQFSGLVEAAKILGLSTDALKWSYKQQAKAIREEAIDAINKEMDAKKENLKQIDDFLTAQRVSDILPGKMRFDEARVQFGEAVGSKDIQKAIAASEQYLNIAKEQFGTTAQFFSARNEVERMLTNLKEQQERNIEAEREKLIMREERELEQVRISRSSVDFLKRISTDNSSTSRGIEQLIGIAKSQTSEAMQTRQLLLRLASKIKA